MVPNVLSIKVESNNTISRDNQEKTTKKNN